MRNRLYFGDNLEVLRAHVADESVDLVYLDPPFNSDAHYNVFFRSPDEKARSVQAEAFRDTWTWNPEAEWAFEEVAQIGGTLATFVGALQSALGRSDLMAYLVMMAVRLHELHRVLKPTGALYLHCDPTASHYLKVMLDGVFGPRRYINEIIWLRSNAHNFKTRFWPRQHDTILFFSKDGKPALSPVYEPYGERQLKRYRKDETGRYYTGQDLTISLVRPRRQFEWRGVTPPSHRSWGASKEQLEAWLDEGRILLRKDGSPRMDGLKRYLDEMKGKQIGSVWTDIDRVKNTSEERLGYPTQKPVALLERILKASTKPGDVVLDPFCGCGTTIHAAQNLDRRWIGIDVAYHAIEVIADRLSRRLGIEPDRDYDLGGRPNDFQSASKLAERDKYQFQWWANYLLGVEQMREVKRGRDQGIDGEIFFAAGPGREGYGRILTSVKGGRNVGVSDLRDFRGVLEREGADAGVFVCLRRPSRDMAQNAASAGFFSVGSTRYPRLQIVSLEEWFDDNARPSLPTTAHLGRRATPVSPGTSKPTKRRRPPDTRQVEMLLPLSRNEHPGEKVHVNPRAIRSADASTAAG